MAKKKKKRLGRGLDALLGDLPLAEPGDTQLKQLSIEQLQRGQYQPRSHMDPQALEDLAESIKAQGVIQPITVRPLASGGFEIIAGERRWRAAQLAGLQQVPVVIHDIPDKSALAVALIENIQRENLNPIEQAQGFKRLIDEFGLTHEEIAQSVGRSRTGVTNLLRLLKLNKIARALLEQRALEMGHARALLALSGTAQDQLAQQIATGGLSVRQAEARVRALAAGKGTKRTAAELDPDIRRLQDQLSDRLGAPVAIQDNNGKGRVQINYHSLDELEGILKHIK